MSALKNPFLFRQLEIIFKIVLISNEGAPLVLNSFVEQDSRLDFASAGEYYRVCCPFCRDRRFRLWINHAFGQRLHGRDLTILAHCFNENCLGKEENRQELKEMLFSSFFQDFDLEVKQRVISQPVAVEEPGFILKLSELEVNHKAILYLKSRGYDPQYLEENFSVGYCQSSRYKHAADRIYIPAYFENKLQFWQCRFIGDMDFKKSYIPKYYSCPGGHKSHFLYNCEQAKDYSVVVIVESPASVWNLGLNTMASFGASLSDQQIEYLKNTCRNSIIVTAFDADVQNSPTILKVVQRLNNSRFENYFNIVVPDRFDLGEIDRNIFRSFVEAEIKKKKELVFLWSDRNVNTKKKYSTNPTRSRTIKRRRS
jgi:hypothetical protein